MRNWPRYIFLCYLFVFGLFVPHSTGEWIPFLWSFQQPTYLLEKDTPWLTLYTCDTSQTACKVNFDFSASIPTDEPSTHYACVVDFWFWVTGQENKCNPSTVEFPVGTWDVHLLIKKISDESIKIDGTFKISHPDGSIDPLRVTILREWQSPTYLLQKDDASLTEYICDSAQPDCKINLKITPLLDGLVSSQLTCEISSDFTLVPTSDPCNPNTSAVPTGDHLVNVKILDTVRWTTLQASSFLLKNRPIDDTIDPLKVTIWLEFQQPTYLIGKDDTALTEYTCDDHSKTECKANLLIAPRLDGAESSKLSCHITTDFGIEENHCNPDTFTIPTGDHTLIIKILSTIDQSIITTRVITLHGFHLNQSVGGWSNSSKLMDFSTVSIVVQSGLDSSFVCRTNICQVNLSSVVPEGALCQWNFGSGTFQTLHTDKNCNPGYVQFSENTAITLTVADPVNSTHTITRSIQIYRTHSSDATTSTTLIQSKITLQWTLGKNKRITPEGIVCETKNWICTLNFTGEKSTAADRYIWDFWDGQAYNGKNPPKHIFSLWKHFVQLTVFWEGNTAVDTYFVEVIGNDTASDEEDCIACDEFDGGLKIVAAFPNPPHADTVEWVEIKNISSSRLDLGSCLIQDDSKKYQLSWFIDPGKVLRFHQILTGLNFWNTHDEIKIVCDGNSIDAFAWDFPIPDGYILRREVLYPEPTKALVSNVVDGDTIDVAIDGKKTRVRLLWVDTPETVHPRKPVEKFGKEASDFTKNTLTNHIVWLTFDHEPVDHYGRRLAYIWQCMNSFSEWSCQLFNARLLTEWYARMERRFEFRRYDDFDILEKKARDAKIGLWSNPEVAKAMNELSREESGIHESEQQEEYLQNQKKILEVCEKDETCSQDKINWKSMTEENSTLKVTQNKNGKVSIVGQTWPDFEVKLSIKQGNRVLPIILHSENSGKYEYEWFPEGIWEIVVQSSLEKESDIVLQEKSINLEQVSDHFLTPLQADIFLQWKKTKNHIEEDGTLYCRSRGSCSVNVTADSNRTEEMSYLWIFPDGSVSDMKNPPSFKIEYGKTMIILAATDNVTGEIVADTLTIRHTPIPKKSHTPSSSKYTFDLKDVPQDIGGGVSSVDVENRQKILLLSLLVLIILASSFFILNKYFFIKF